MHTNKNSTPFSYNSTYKYYEKYAENYFQTTYSTDLTNQWNKFTHLLPKNASILDIGSGSGRDLRYFSARGFRTTGLDYSYNLAKIAHKYSNQNIIVGDLRYMPIDKIAFEAVWAIGSLLHISRIEIPPVLLKIYSSLKRNGVLFTAIKKGNGEIFDSMGRYISFYQTDQWVYLLNQAGFNVISIEEVIEHRHTTQGSINDIEWVECLAIKSPKNYISYQNNFIK